MRSIGILLFPDVEELDFVGPWELFGVWHDVADGPPCTTIAAVDGPIRCRKGLRVLPDTSLDDAPAVDVLLVPGGDGTRALVDDAAVLAWIRSQAAAAQHVVSVCTGARVLHAAGLLDGRTVTTHASALDEARGWEGVAVSERRFVHDTTGGRSVWTAAGVSAGLDVSLALIAHVGGDDVAARVQRYAEYFPDDRVYGTTPWDDAPDYVSPSPS